MKKLNSICVISCMYCLMACTTVAETSDADLITRAEAKNESCPKSVLEAGASQEDCSCVEDRLYTLGQTPRALKTESGSIHESFGKEDGKRKIAIGLLRHDAMEYCGLFDPDHIVSKNL